MPRINKDNRIKLSNHIQNRSYAFYCIGLSYSSAAVDASDQLGFPVSASLASKIARELSVEWRGSAPSLYDATNSLDGDQWDKVAMFLGRAKGSLYRCFTTDYYRRKLFEDKGIKAGEIAILEGMRAAKLIN